MATPLFALTDRIALQDGLTLISPEIAVQLSLDVLYYTDTVATPTLGLTVLTGDAIALSDVQTDAVKFVLPFPLPLATPDRILLIDSVQIAINGGVAGLQVSVGDGLNLGDSKSLFYIGGFAVADTLALSDTNGFSPGYVTSDSLALSDAATNSLANIFLNLTESVSDSLALADAVQLASRSTAVAVGDTFQFSDAVFVAFTSNFLPYLRRYLNDV